MTHAVMCCRLHCGLTLRRDADKCKRRHHLCAVCLRKLIFVLLRLLPRLADTHCPTLLAQFEHVRSHQVGVAKAVRERERRGNHAKAQYRCVGRLVPLIGEGNVACRSRA